MTKQKVYPSRLDDSWWEIETRDSHFWKLWECAFIPHWWQMFSISEIWEIQPDWWEAKLLARKTVPILYKKCSPIIGLKSIMILYLRRIFVKFIRSFYLHKPNLLHVQIMAWRRVGNKPPIETAISKILHIVSLCVATKIQHCLLSFICLHCSVVYVYTMNCTLTD